jgi:adenylate cyclase
MSPRAFAPRLQCAHGSSHDDPEQERGRAELVHEVREQLSRLGWGASIIGSIVVFVAIGLSIPIFIDAGDRNSLGLFNAPLVVTYVVVAGYLVRRSSDRYIYSTLEWIVEGREPDEGEHRRTLGLAVHMVKMVAIGWAVGAALLSVANGFAHSWDFAAIVVATTWLGGETTCALTYLAAERILRPVTACALSERLPSGTVAPGVRGRLLGAWALGTGVPLLGVIAIGVVGLTKSGVDTEYFAAAVVFYGLGASGAGLMATLFAAKAIAHPITSVRRGLERIERGDLDVQVAVDDGSEVGLLQAGFNQMSDGLTERERIRDLFGRQVGEDVAREALTEGTTRLGGEERHVGALFVDIVGATSMALAMPPTEVVRLLNRFFRVVVNVVEAEGAIVNKFEGDAAMCVFGAPVPCDDPAADALRAARELAARLTRDVPEIDFGIGISAGIAVAGNVGAEHRFEYTVIGDPVNEASRLSELAKQRPERVLASEAALRAASDDESDVWQMTDSAVLRGRDAPTGVAHPRLSETVSGR